MLDALVRVHLFANVVPSVDVLVALVRGLSPTAFNRFFNEACVPKIAYPDQDGAMMKALENGEISLLDLQGNLHKQRGIMFECCLPQGHYQHG